MYIYSPLGSYNAALRHFQPPPTITSSIRQRFRVVLATCLDRGADRSKALRRVGKNFSISRPGLLIGLCFPDKRDLIYLSR